MVNEKSPSWEEIHRIQIREILKHKWIQSEKEGRDLGEEAVEDWIQKHAAEFRAYWDERLRDLEDREDSGEVQTGGQSIRGHALCQGGHGRGRS